MVRPPHRLVSHRRLLGTSASAPPAGDEAAVAHGSSPNSVKIMVSVLVVVIFCTLLYCVYCWRWRKRNAVRRTQNENMMPLSRSISELPLMDLASIDAATSNFARANKLGESGFGPVYRGVMACGAEIAVKRLSMRSLQGAAEFRNEVELIAKLQHRNLVRLLGWCAEQDEKLLVYEYLPNGSLDAFLFDTSKSTALDWNSRHNIIIGIARGLLYLHENSLLKVIHRDLKPSNVLLDNKMNPKISDFGLARIFKDECNGVNTGRVVGTYGYMAPEFVMDSVFSAKSDVFGFGVLLLEILSGKRNGISYLEEHQQSLIQDAWKFWIDDRANEFIDSAIGQSYSRDEAWRCFQISLLCVQDDPDIRPTMSNVLLMLVSEQISLPAPSKPVRNVPLLAPSAMLRSEPLVSQKSIKYASITDIQPR
ncbi:hypothetical protein CFC21_103005 [Triticum aestivum]|uniref:non-specific serine/threonine protein kinase n=3 Tax=Triticum TaxID=4564 RepID=A0A9R1M6Q6_WHEAT|nr:hypothetical protein CFC21_103005 [Triticum aestivum]